MAVTSNVAAVKFKLKFAEGKGTYTFSKLNKSALDDDIFLTASAIADIKANITEDIYKIVDTEHMNG